MGAGLQGQELGWVGSRPLLGVVCTVTASFPAGHDWTRVTKMSGHKACRTVGSPQTTPSDGVREIPPCLCVFLFAWWVRGAPGRHIGSRGPTVPSLVRGLAWQGLYGWGVLVVCVPGDPGPGGRDGEPNTEAFGGLWVSSLRAPGAKRTRCAPNAPTRVHGWRRRSAGGTP